MKKMMKNEKGIATNDAQNLPIDNQTTMKNYTPNTSEFQTNSAQFRQNLFESTKLSRLPKLSTRSKFELPEFELSSDTATADVCVGCGGRLDLDDAIQQRFCGCRQCVGIYGRLDAAADEHDKRKRRETLERFAGGAK